MGGAQLHPAMGVFVLPDMEPSGPIPSWALRQAPGAACVLGRPHVQVGLVLGACQAPGCRPPLKTPTLLR